MKKTLDHKICLFMDEYYALQFYEMKPTIKYYLVKMLLYNMYT